MAKRKKCIAMLLAGGQGSRLGALTKDIAKPAVSFGAKYRMIDFSLSNCSNSNIDTVGVLTQYRPFRLNAYVGSGRPWDINDRDGGIYILPPYATEKGGTWYSGTADAIYRNLDFIDIYNPEYVLILSVDHLYSMDYREMLKSHIETNAVATISSMEVEWEEASRFGIITANEDGTITKFSEKPKNPDSNLASMGIYIFNKDVLVKSLIEDSKVENSDHDFGKNIIPNLLAQGQKLNCYKFEGFWKDVGTIPSYYETSMELLEPDSKFDLFSESMPIMSNANLNPPQYIGPKGSIKKCIVSNGAIVLGQATNCILSSDCFIGEDAIVRNSVLLPGAVVESGAVVEKAILGEESVVKEGTRFGSLDADSDIAVLGNKCETKGE